MNPHGIQIEITLQETLDEHWAAWFEGLTLTALDNGATLIQGELKDHSALHGTLEQIRDLNLKLFSIKVEEK